MAVYRMQGMRLAAQRGERVEGEDSDDAGAIRGSFTNDGC